MAQPDAILPACPALASSGRLANQTQFLRGLLGTQVTCFGSKAKHHDRRAQQTSLKEGAALLFSLMANRRQRRH